MFARDVGTCTERGLYVRPNTYHKYTNADLKYISEHLDDSPREIASVIGGARGTVSNYMSKIRRGDFSRKPYPPQKYYAVYLRKTDELVCSGSAQECADSLGICKRAFYILAHKAASGKVKKWDVYIEPYNSEDDF